MLPGIRKGLWLLTLSLGGSALAAPLTGLGPCTLIDVVEGATSHAKASAFVVQEATGEAAVVENDEPAAIKKATEAAIREAVQQAAGVILESDTVTANSQLVKDQITTHTQGYVHSSKVLSKEVSGGVATVKVRVEVGRQALSQDLQAIKNLVKRLENKKVVIFLDESAIHPDHTTSHPGTFSAVLGNAFKEDGWTLIDPSFLSGSVDLRPGVEVQPSQLRALGNLGRVDYVIKGNVKYFFEEPSGPLAQLMFSGGKQTVFPVNGAYELDIFATDTGLEIAKLSENFDDRNHGADAGAHPFIPEASLSYDEAASAAVKSQKGPILEKVRGAVVKHLQAAELDGRSIQLTVGGLSYTRMKDVVAQIKGSDVSVRATHDERFDNGTLTVFVSYVGSPDELADRLSRMKFGSQMLEITKVSANAVEAKLAK